MRPIKIIIMIILIDILPVIHIFGIFDGISSSTKFRLHFWTPPI